jgi:hypothetical protein
MGSVEGLGDIDIGDNDQVEGETNVDDEPDQVSGETNVDDELDQVVGETDVVGDELDQAAGDTSGVDETAGDANGAGRVRVAGEDELDEPDTVRCQFCFSPDGLFRIVGWTSSTNALVRLRALHQIY